MLCLSVNMDEVKGMQVEVSGNQVLSILRQQLTMSGSEEVDSDSVGTKLVAGEKYHVKVVLATPTTLSTSVVSANLQTTSGTTVFNEHVRLSEYFIIITYKL